MSPPECDPNEQTTPPCAPPSPPPSLSIGGEIYFGTTELIDGKIRVPINTTETRDPYNAVQRSIVVTDEALLTFSSPAAERAQDGVFETNQLFCAVR